MHTLPHFKMAATTTKEKSLASHFLWTMCKNTIALIYAANFSTEYRDKHKKNNCWEAIEEMLDLSPDQAEKKFKNTKTVYARFLTKSVLSCFGRKAVPVQCWIWRIARTMLSDLGALDILSAIAVIIWKPLSDRDEKKMSNFTNDTLHIKCSEFYLCFHNSVVKFDIFSGFREK